MALQNRYEFMYFVACTNANPNGDPDMGNMPRIDPQTMQGFITDVATKRRIRNYIEIAYPGVPGMGIFFFRAFNPRFALCQRNLLIQIHRLLHENPHARHAKKRVNSSTMCAPLGL